MLYFNQQREINLTMEINSSMIKVIVTTVTIGLVGTSIVYIISKLRSKKLTKPFIPVGVVKKLLIYPIKSLKPIECDQVIVKPNEGLYCNQLRDRFVTINQLINYISNDN